MTPTEGPLTPGAHGLPRNAAEMGCGWGWPGQVCLGGRAGTAEKDSFPAAETSLVSRQGESPRLSAASDFSSPPFPPPLFSSSPAPGFFQGFFAF